MAGDGDIRLWNGPDSERRRLTLTRLLPGAAALVAREDQAAGEDLIARLSRALRLEGSKARVGHWSYDRNRHVALGQALACERERLAWLRSQSGRDLGLGSAMDGQEQAR